MRERMREDEVYELGMIKGEWVRGICDVARVVQVK